MKRKTRASKARVSKIPKDESSEANPPLYSAGMLALLRKVGVVIDESDEDIELVNVEDLNFRKKRKSVEDPSQHTRRKRLQLCDLCLNNVSSLYPEVQADEAKGCGKPRTDEDIDYGGPSAARGTSNNFRIAPSLESSLAAKEWTSLGHCFVCKKGNQVLICSTSDCDIKVHASCLQFQSSGVGSTGRFYCPLCVFKRDTLELEETEEKLALAQKKVQVSRKCLESFVNECTQTEPIVQRQREEQISNHDNVQLRGSNSESSVEILEVQQEPIDSTERTFKDRSAVEQPLASKRNVGTQTGEVNHAKQVSTLSYTSTGRLDNVQERGSNRENSVEILEVQQEPIDCIERTFTDRSAVEQPLASKRNDGMQTGEVNHAKQVCSSEQKSMNHQKDEVAEYQCTSGSLGVDINLRSETKDTSVTTGKSVKEELGRAGVIESEKHPEDVELVCGSSCSDTEASAGRVRCGNLESTQLMLDVSVENTPPLTSIGAAETSRIQNEKNKEIPEEKKKYRKLPEYPSNLAHGSSKRKNAWTDEEENMLKEGVRKCKGKINKNIPWRSILEEGSGIFNKTRTAADLKDKWKNMKRAAQAQSNIDPVFDI